MATSGYTAGSSGIFITSLTFSRSATRGAWYSGTEYYWSVNYVNNGLRKDASNATVLGSSTAPYGSSTWNASVGSTVYWSTGSSGTISATTQYTLTVNAGANGTVSGGGNYISGATATLVATPNTHYSFASWSDSGTQTHNVTVTADATITATFAQSQWQLFAVTESSSKGTVSPSGWTSGDWFNAGITKTITATPVEGYKFVGWFRTGQSTPDYTTATANLLTYSANTTYTAVFAYKFHALNVSANYSNRGSVKLYIDGTEQTATTELSVEEGKTLRIVAATEWFCLFPNWTINSSNVSYADYTFVMPTADCSAVANFNVRDSFTLSIAKENPTFGTVSLYRSSNILLATDTGSSLVETAYEGVEYTLKATLADSRLYRFLGWYNASNELISADASTTLTVADAAATSITAKFDNNPNYTLSVNVSDGNDYAAENPAEVAGNTVEISTAADFDGPPESWLSNTDVSILATPVAGWSLAGWFLDGTVDVTYDEVPPDNPLIINLASNSVLTAHFSINTYQVDVEMDADSADHGSVSVSYTPTGGEAQTGSPLTVTHGDTLTFTATPDSGYTFEGWYKDGVKVDGATATYTTPAIVGACAYTCKLTAVVSITAEASGDGAVGFLDADGSAIVVQPNNGVYSLDVVLGESVRVSASSAGGSDYFQKWFTTGDATKSPLAGFSSDTTFEVTETTAITALFSVTPVTRFLMVTNGTDGLGMGTVSSSAGTAITRAAFATGVGSSLGTIPAEITGDKFYSFDSIATTLVGCTPASGKVFVKWQIMRAGESSFTDYSTDISAQLVMSSDCIVRAVYQTASPLLIKAAYATGSNSTFGALLIEPEGTSPVSTASYESAYFVQGNEVTVNAIPENGYVFLGWYGSAAASGAAISTSASYTFTVSTTATLYAKFAQDDNAVYKWEGGTASKMIEWRSKRYVSNKPFNPSSAKVYATVYPVALSLYMCGSPDVPSTTPKVEVSVRNQDGRRLPMARPEKYIEIGVKASGEVSEVAVATSMEGLAQ